MNPLEFFDQNPVFTHEEFKQYAISQGSVNENTQREILAYHLRKKNIIRIRNGLFASIPISSRKIADSFFIDPYLIAGRITNDAILSYHTAFDFYGVSYSNFHRVIFLSQKKIRPFTFQQTEFICLPFPKALIEKNKTEIEVTTVDRQGLNIQVTSFERTLVDALDRPDFAGGWEEIWRATEQIPFLYYNQAIQYALLLGNATTIAKLGFFLEQHQERFKVDESSLKRLESKKPKGIHYLERNKRERGHFIKRWNLMVPKQITERAWEEPINDLI